MNNCSSFRQRNQCFSHILTTRHYYTWYVTRWSTSSGLQSFDEAFWHCTQRILLKMTVSYLNMVPICWSSCLTPDYRWP